MRAERGVGQSLPSFTPFFPKPSQFALAFLPSSGTRSSLSAPAFLTTARETEAWGRSYALIHYRIQNFDY